MVYQYSAMEKNYWNQTQLFSKDLDQYIHYYSTDFRNPDSDIFHHKLTHPYLTFTNSFTKITKEFYKFNKVVATNEDNLITWNNPILISHLTQYDQKDPFLNY